MWSQIIGKMKATKNEIKKNVQGTNNDGEETGTQINGVDQRKKETANQNRIEKQEFKKNKKRLRNLWDNFKRSNIQIIAVPKEEEQHQETENLFENIMQENFPIW